MYSDAHFIGPLGGLQAGACIRARLKFGKDTQRERRAARRVAGHPKWSAPRSVNQHRSRQTEQEPRDGPNSRKVVVFNVRLGGDIVKD